MKVLQITEKNVLVAFENGDESQQELLKALWPDLFKKDPYLLACTQLGINPEPPLADRSNKRKVAADAFERLTICIEAKNAVDGKAWVPVYNGSEQHYWPVFDLSSGFGFSYSYCDGWLTFTTVGARLEYRTRELAEEGAKEFEDLYRDFLTL